MLILLLLKWRWCCCCCFSAEKGLRILDIDLEEGYGSVQGILSISTVSIEERLRKLILFLSVWCFFEEGIVVLYCGCSWVGVVVSRNLNYSKWFLAFNIADVWLFL